MAERKVLNKYYPPEFDPSKIQSYEKKFTDSICSARMMLPLLFDVMHVINICI